MKGQRKRKEICTYNDWEAALDRQIETVFTRQQRKNPHMSLYAQLDLLIRVNSPRLPLLKQLVEYIYDEHIQAQQAAAAEEDE
jgi:hypothetical protein